MYDRQQGGATGEEVAVVVVVVDGWMGWEVLVVVVVRGSAWLSFLR